MEKTGQTTRALGLYDMWLSGFAVGLERFKHDGTGATSSGWDTNQSLKCEYK